MKKELAVAALQNGTVIDHIPASALFKAVKILGIENMSSSVTIGNNLSSERLGSKGIIKVADVEFPESVLDRIALIAPTAVVNVIRNFEVASKRPVALAETVVGIVKCDNPKCITNNEPMDTRFHVVSHADAEGRVRIRCHYCNHEVDNITAQIL